MIAVPLLVGVALGSVPFAWLLVRLTRGVDLARTGSGNVGALNSLRVSGSKAVGAAALLLDVAKGAAAATVALAFAEGRGATTADLWWTAATVGVVLGHVHNPWLGFRGGKGFAALAGAALVHAPWTVPAWLAVLLVSWAAFRVTKGIRDEAPASLVATLVVPGFAFLVYGPFVSLAFAGALLLVLPRLWPEVRAVVSAPGTTSNETGSES